MDSDEEIVNTQPKKNNKKVIIDDESDDDANNVVTEPTTNTTTTEKTEKENTENTEVKEDGNMEIEKNEKNNTVNTENNTEQTENTENQQNMETEAMNFEGGDETQSISLKKDKKRKKKEKRAKMLKKLKKRTRKAIIAGEDISEIENLEKEGGLPAGFVEEIRLEIAELERQLDEEEEQAIEDQVDYGVDEEYQPERTKRKRRRVKELGIEDSMGNLKKRRKKEAVAFDENGFEILSERQMKKRQKEEAEMAFQNMCDVERKDREGKMLSLDGPGDSETKKEETTKKVEEQPSRFGKLAALLKKQKQKKADAKKK